MKQKESSTKEGLNEGLFMYVFFPQVRMFLYMVWYISHNFCFLWILSKKEGVILYLGGGGAKNLFVIFVYVGDFLE